MRFEYEKCLQKGIKFLEKIQQSDGSFFSLTSSDKNNFNNAKKYNSTFSSSLILACINNVDSGGLKLKIVKFILSQKSEIWSFNYWKRNSIESRKMPYPDDLDDTFCALSAVYQFDPSILNGKALAKIITLLTLVEEKEGGPYKTWIVSSDSEKAWKDVDLAVNSNVGFFLYLNEINLPNINSMIEKKIESNDYFSPYYPSEFPVIYFISRFYRGKKKNKLIEFIISLKNKKEDWGTPLHTALAVSALINLGYLPSKLEDSIDYLIKNQIEEKWDTEAFCIDPAIKKEIHYSGSTALTTAFCLEAIQKYMEQSNKRKEKETKDNKAQKIKKIIINEVKNKIAFFEKDAREIFDRVLFKIIKNDSQDQITLLPYFFRESLGENKKRIDDEFVIRLGSANLLGWIAYTIYDDFLDGEGEAKTLPLANVCSRELLRIFFEIESEVGGFDYFFRQSMNGLEKSNFWEVSNCRAKVAKNKIFISPKDPYYQNLSKISDRSMGHILGLVAISLKMGNGRRETGKVVSCFRNYIIAKQLNDDAHDWEEDMKKGNLSPVVCDLMRIFKNRYQNGFIDFSKDKEKLQKIFWLEVIDKISKNIIQNCLEAQKIFKTVNIIENSDLFLKFFQSVEKSARKTLKEKKEVAVFLKSIKV